VPCPGTENLQACSPTWEGPVNRNAGLPVRSIRALGTGLAGPPNDPGALVGVAVGWPPGAGGFRVGTATEIGLSGGPPFGLLQVTSGGGLSEEPPKFAWIPQATLGYAEKVRSQFLSLRQLLSSHDSYGAGWAENPQ